MNQLSSASGQHSIATPWQRKADAEPKSADDLAINALVAELYQCISFEEGSEPDWERMRGLFSVHAAITRLTPEIIDYLDVNRFQAMAQELMDVGAYTSFHEMEVASSSSVYGSIANRISLYETRSSETTARPLARGVNLLQLVREGGEWRVLSLLWQDEMDPALLLALEKGLI